MHRGSACLIWGFAAGFTTAWLYSRYTQRVL